MTTFSEQSFTGGVEVLGINEPDRYVSNVGEDDEDDGEIEGGGERVDAKKAEPTRQILLVKRKANLVGQNLSSLYTTNSARIEQVYHACRETLSEGMARPST